MDPAVRRAIDQSIGQNRTVTIPYTEERFEDLVVESEDYDSVGKLTEFWGTDEDLNDWKVALRR